MMIIVVYFMLSLLMIMRSIHKGLTATVFLFR